MSDDSKSFSRIIQGGVFFHMIKSRFRLIGKSKFKAIVNQQCDLFLPHYPNAHILFRGISGHKLLCAF